MVALLLAAAAAVCPDDQLIGLKLKPWKVALLADVPGSDEQHAEMAALRMKIVPDGNESEADCYAKPVVEGVDIFEANLTGLNDKLVQVRFRMCKGTPDEWQSLRVAVLVPQPDDHFCLLDGGDELAVDRSVKSRLCEKPGKLPMTFALKEVVEKGRKVVETREEQGSCEGEAPMSSLTMALYQAQGWSLKKIFDTVLIDTHPVANGNLITLRSTVTMGPGFPRPIRVERCLEGAHGCDTEEWVYSKAAAKYVSK